MGARSGVSPQAIRLLKKELYRWVNSMDELYRDAMKEQVSGLKEEIEDILVELGKNPVASRMVYRSSERTLHC